MRTVFCTLTMVFALSAALTGRGAAESLGEFTPLAVPRPAPELAFTTLGGEARRLADFRGQTVLVNLWATWCGPCVEEMPSLDRLQQKLGPSLTIIALSEDRRGAALVDPFLAKIRIKSLSVYLDPKNAALPTFGVEGLPTSFLIDRAGDIVGFLEGAADWDSDAMLTIVDRYLAEPPKS